MKFFKIIFLEKCVPTSAEKNIHKRHKRQVAAQANFKWKMPINYKFDPTVGMIRRGNMQNFKNDYNL